MLITLASIVLLSFGGLAVTYFLIPKATFLWRLCAGNVIGSAIAGLALFLLSEWIGFNVPTILVAYAVAALPLFILRRKSVKAEFAHDWAVAKGKLQGSNIHKFAKFLYYAFFALLFLAFFGKAMIVAADGIFTGGSQNLGDLPFHLGAIFSFTDGANFPPTNPSFAGAKFTYPFVADLLTASLVKLGAAVDTAMWVQNVSWAFSLLVILEAKVKRLTGSRLAGKFAVPLLFFSGGFGFLWFLKDYWQGAQGIWELIWHLPKDYTIGDDFRWGNSLVTLFITQRSLLLGMPLALAVIGYLWGLFATEGAAKTERGKVEGVGFAGPIPIFVLGLITGTLPLIHAHSLAVVFVISGCWFFFSLHRWKEWIAFAAGVSLIAIPELAWILAGSASKTSEFIGWHYGFDSNGQNLLWFWLKNTGLFIPLLVSSALIVIAHGRAGKLLPEDEGEGDIHKSLDTAHDGARDVRFYDHFAVYYLPFLVLFIVSNVMKLAPWQWDNIKVLIYWYVGSIPLAALVLAWFWEKSRVWKALAVACFAVLIFSGALDVWRTASGQIRNQVFDADAVEMAEWIRFNTDPKSLFLNAPTYNPAVVLSGRQSLMRYIGHLSSHGIDYQPREEDLRKIYSGAPDADALLKKYGIDYVLITPREREALQVNTTYFSRFKLVHQEGGYLVYEVGKPVREP